MEILQTLKADMMSVMFIYLIFALGYIANVVFSLYYNTKVLDMHFIKKKFFNGLYKAIVIIVGSLLLVTAIDLFMVASSLHSVPNADLVTIAAVIATVGLAAIKYIKEAFETLVTILNAENTKITKE